MIPHSKPKPKPKDDKTRLQEPTYEDISSLYYYHTDSEHQTLHRYYLSQILSLHMDDAVVCESDLRQNTLDTNIPKMHIMHYPIEKWSRCKNSKRKTKRKTSQIVSNPLVGVSRIFLEDIDSKLRSIHDRNPQWGSSDLLDYGIRRYGVPQSHGRAVYLNIDALHNISNDTRHNLNHFQNLVAESVFKNSIPASALPLNGLSFFRIMQMEKKIYGNVRVFLTPLYIQKHYILLAYINFGPSPQHSTELPVHTWKLYIFDSLFGIEYHMYHYSEYLEPLYENRILNRLAGFHDINLIKIPSLQQTGEWECMYIVFVIILVICEYFGSTRTKFKERELFSILQKTRWRDKISEIVALTEIDRVSIWRCYKEDTHRVDLSIPIEYNRDKNVQESTTLSLELSPIELPIIIPDSPIDLTTQRFGEMITLSEAKEIVYNNLTLVSNIMREVDENLLRIGYFIRGVLYNDIDGEINLDILYQSSVLKQDFSRRLIENNPLYNYGFSTLLHDLDECNLWKEIPYESNDGIGRKNGFIISKRIQPSLSYRTKIFEWNDTPLNVIFPENSTYIVDVLVSILVLYCEEMKYKNPTSLEYKLFLQRCSWIVYRDVNTVIQNSSGIFPEHYLSNHVNMINDPIKLFIIGRKKQRYWKRCSLEDWIETSNTNMKTRWSILDSI